MKKIGLILTMAYVALALGLGMGIASATEDWFLNPNTVYFTTPAFATPYSIASDCITDGSQCLAAVYAETTLSGNGVFLYSSTNNFQTVTPLTSIAVDYSALRAKIESQNETYVQFPLAVKYNTANGLYYIMLNDKVYSYDLITLTLVHSSASNTRYLGLVNTNEPYIYAIEKIAAPQDVNIDIISLYNGSIVIDDLASVTQGGTNTINYGYGWFVATNPPAGTNYRYFWKWNPTGFPALQFSTTNSTNLPSAKIYNYNADYNFLRYYDNVSGITGVYRTLTSDFTSFTNTLNEFQYNPTETNITSYSSTATDESIIYSYVNWTSTNTNTAYFYQQPLFQTIISSSYYDVQSQYYRTNLNVSSQLECLNTTYSDSGDNLLSILHPCDNYLLTTISSSSYRPVSFTINTSIQDGCNYNLVYARFIKDYNFTITVFDDVTQLPVPNAFVQFGSQSAFTDANGDVNFVIMPLNNVSMIKTSYDVDCREEYVASASSLTVYSLTISKNGYTTYFSPDIEPAEFTAGNTITYSKGIQVNLLPVGGNVIVKLRDANGREIINPDLSSRTEITTNGSVYIIDSVTSEPLLGNSGGGVPINFFITSNASSFNVTVNFTYQSFNDSKIVTVNQDDVTIVYFRLNQSITELECETNSDCSTSFCLADTYFYELNGCVGNTCNYGTPELCTGGCDPEIGCYERKFNIPCETRHDCQSNCSSSFISQTGLCASDGFCVQIKDICNIPCENNTLIGCNATTGRCCESDNCYNLGLELFFFNLGYVYTCGIIPTLTTINLVDTHFTCTYENQRDRFCIQGATIPKKINCLALVDTRTGVVSVPVEWQFKTTLDDYIFLDVSVSCNPNCEASYEYCEYGCDLVSGYCKIQSVDEADVIVKYGIDIYKPLPIIENSVNQTQFQESGLGFVLLFFTPIFLVTVLGALIGIAAAYFTKEPVIGIAILTATFIVFSLLGLYPIWIPLVVIIIAGLILSKTITQFIKGG